MMDNRPCTYQVWAGVFLLYYIQARIKAASPDEAALRIRDRFGEYDGKLTVLHVFDDWYEYCLELTRGQDIEIRDGRFGSCV
mgnify:FL=1|jgi:hypothetical protein